MKITLSLEQILNGRNWLPIVAVRDWYEYTPEGQRGKRLGSVYTGLILDSGCQTIDVKVEDSEPVITQDDLNQANLLLKFFTGKFKNFEATPYVGANKQMKISSKADEIELTKPQFTDTKRE